MPERTVPCAHCGILYTARRSDSVACSPKCSYRLRQGAAYSRACQSCGVDISGRMGNARYCEPCSARRAEVHESDRKARRPWYSRCRSCGTEFEPTQDKRYCTPSCAGKHNRAKQLSKVHTKQCPACLEDFATMDLRRGECSVACKQWAQKYPGVQRMLERECLHCCQPFRANTAAQRFCEYRCARRASKIRRRAQERSAYVEDVSKGAIAARDKWTCQLCGKKVDKTLEWPHPRSWSLDHIIPLSRGGDHSRANTQLAHLVCNVSKGNRLRAAQQLALIG